MKPKSIIFKLFMQSIKLKTRELFMEFSPNFSDELVTSLNHHTLAKARLFYFSFLLSYSIAFFLINIQFRAYITIRNHGAEFGLTLREA